MSGGGDGGGGAGRGRGERGSRDEATVGLACRDRDERRLCRTRGPRAPGGAQRRAREAAAVGGRLTDPCTDMYCRREAARARRAGPRMPAADGTRGAAEMRCGVRVTGHRRAKRWEGMRVSEVPEGTAALKAQATRGHECRRPRGLARCPAAQPGPAPPIPRALPSRAPALDSDRTAAAAAQAAAPGHRGT